MTLHGASVNADGLHSPKTGSPRNERPCRRWGAEGRPPCAPGWPRCVWRPHRGALSRAPNEHSRHTSCFQDKAETGAATAASETLPQGPRGPQINETGAELQTSAGSRLKASSPPLAPGSVQNVSILCVSRARRGPGQPAVQKPSLSGSPERHGSAPRGCDSICEKQTSLY